MAEIRCFGYADETGHAGVFDKIILSYETSKIETIRISATLMIIFLRLDDF